MAFPLLGGLFFYSPKQKNNKTKYFIMNSLQQHIKTISLIIIFILTLNGMSLFQTESHPQTLNYNHFKQLRKTKKVHKPKLNEDKFKVVEFVDSISQTLETNTNIYLLKNNKNCFIKFNFYKTDNIYQTISFIENKCQSTDKKKLNMISGIVYIPPVFPIRDSDYVGISTGFGWRMHPIFHIMLMHEGIDINTKRGTDVFASADGIVVKVEYSKYNYGNHIVIQHSFGYKTLYAHLNTIAKLKEGDVVKRGQLIGTVGSTGLSTGPHLHFEVSHNNIKQNPLNYYYQ